MLYPYDGELLDEGMHVTANLTTRRHSERKEGVDSGERAVILVFLPLDCVGEVFSYCRAAFSRLELALGLAMAMSSRSTVFLSRGWLSKSVLASIVMSVRRGLNLLFCPLASYRKGHVSSTINWTLLSPRYRASAWWSTRLWVRKLHLVFAQDIARRWMVSCR